MTIELRPCTAADKPFVYEVTEAAMRPYVEEAFGSWDASAERRRSNAAFNPATCRIIVVDGTPAGVFAVETRASEIYLSKIYILPAFQRRGIGAQLLRQLIARAQAEKKPLRLRVLLVNPAARALYERLGFEITDSSTSHHYMEHRRPHAILQHMPPN